MDLDISLNQSIRKEQFMKFKIVVFLLELTSEVWQGESVEHLKPLEFRGNSSRSLAWLYIGIDV